MIQIKWIMNCEGRLVEPKILPCGETICSLCEALIQLNDQMFDCLVCKKKHKMSQDGLLNNNLVDFLKELCMDLRNDVQLTAEEVILQVNDLSSKLIEEKIEFNKANKESLEHFNEIVRELESFH